MKCIVIGSSTGGPKAVDYILSNLPDRLNAAVVILQHISKEVARSMAERIDEELEIDVHLATDNEKLERGHVYIVPGSSHFFIISPELKIRLLEAEDKKSPSIDMGFTSIAEHFGEDSIGVILTGMGHDGTLGARAIKKMGGMVLVQDEETSVVYGMPKSASYVADEVLPLDKIPNKLIELVSK